jgi:membrane fusion protein (multidrug efflux system)
MVSTDLPGVVREISFESGQSVEKGDQLVKLDVSVEEAELESARASTRLAELNLKRERSLVAKRAGAQAELDLAEATFRQAESRIASLQATLERKIVRAPFAGRLGIRLVNLGQYLGPGEPVVSLQQPSPMYVDFTLPQQHLGQIEPEMVTRLRTDADLEQVFAGVLTAINPDVDVRTRNLRLRATFDNADERLCPGMFVRVELVLPGVEQVIAIPATAVQHSGYGTTVYVVEESAAGATVVRQRLVRLGRAQGDFVAVTEGLRAGETVVTAGGFKLRNNMRVRINNQQTPQPRLDPRPSEA